MTWRLAAESVIPIEPEGVAFSARLFKDGSMLALVSRKRPAIVTLWDSATGQQTGVLQPGPDGPSSSTYGMALSPDGRTLAAAHSHARVILWDVVTGRVRTTLRGPTGATICFRFAFTPDGHSLVGAGHMWAGGLPVSRLYPAARSLGLQVDDRPILEWVVWDVARRQVRSALTEPSPTRVPPGTAEAIGISGNFALTPDGRTLATAHRDGTIRLREIGYDTRANSMRSSKVLRCSRHAGPGR